MEDEFLSEDFSTAILCMLFGLLRDYRLRNSVLSLQILVRGDTVKPLSQLLALDDTTEVWMCRDLLRGIKEPAPSDAEYQGKCPDVWCEDKQQRTLLISNKSFGGGNRNDELGREACYLKFLREKRRGRGTLFLYALPEAWTASGEWYGFLNESDADAIVKRGILRWAFGLEDLLTAKFGLPEWFRDKLPSRVDRNKFL